MREGLITKHATTVGAGWVAVVSTSTSIIPMLKPRTTAMLAEPRRGTNSPRGRGQRPEHGSGAQGKLLPADWPSPSTGNEIPKLQTGALPDSPSALRRNRGERIRLEKSGGTGAIPSDFVDLSLDDEAAHRAGRYRRCRSSRGGDNGLWASSHQVCGRPEPTHRSWHRQWVCACPAFPAFPRR